MRLPRTSAPAAALLAGALALGLAGAPATAPAAAAAADERPRTVDGWPVRSPAALDLRGSAVEAGAREARRLGSTCFAVVRDGAVAGEWSWGTDRDAPREVYSVTKSVTSTLVGIAVRDGDLRLDDRVSRYVPQWRGTPSESVTVRHLLSNDSGRFWSLETDYQGLVLARSRTRYAVGLTQQHPPGTAWAYNNAAIQVLEPVLEEATGMSVARFARTRLFEPLGMTHSSLTSDRAGDTAVFYGMQTTCLDLARLGTLLLGSGRASGERLLDRSYVRRAVGRSSTVHNAAYGWLWWLNRPGRLRGATDPVDAQGQPLSTATGQLAPDSPDDVYAAIGLGGQVLLVDPHTRTLVVRIGAPAEAGEREYGFDTAAGVLEDALGR